MGERGYQPSNTCPNCGYRSDPGRCPECGQSFTARSAIQERRFRFWNRLAGYGNVAFGIFYAVVIGAALLTPGRQSTCGNRGGLALPARAAAPERVDDSELHNLVDLGIGVFSGAAPDGETGFARLARLGIRTIVSVDGASPDVERAAAHGMRYVHLPIFYSGVPADKGRQLTKAIRDLPKPIYVHCHHGKHRGPAATALALVSLGKMDNPSARRFLEICGTSPSYAGLYRDVENARPVPGHTLDALAGDWPERASVGDTVQTMTEIEQALDRLEKTRAAGWAAPADHPDLVPYAEAALIAEHFRELARLPESNERPADFRKSLEESEAAAWCLRDQLTAESPQKEKLKECLETLKANCKSCHRAYRDN